MKAAAGDPGPCGKICWPSRKDAKRANKYNPSSLRAYFCESCRAWHVTKRTR